MLSSLFPRESLYSDIDNHANGAVHPRAMHATAAGQEHNNRGSQQSYGLAQSPEVALSVPDPFEVEETTPSALAAALPTTSEVYDAALSLNPFEFTKQHNIQVTAQSNASIATDFPKPFSQYHADESDSNRNLEDTEPEHEPPKSIMFGASHGNVAWGNPHLSTVETVHQHGVSPPSNTSNSPFEKTNGAGQHVAAVSQAPHTQQTPWWLRQSRIDLRSPEFQDGGSSSAQLHTSHYSRPELAIAHKSRSILPSSTSNFIKSAANHFTGRPGSIRLTNSLSRKERALWKWANVEDLDAFLQDVYTFYIRKGLYSITLTQCLDLITIGFVIAFSTFLLACVDYSIIRQHHALASVIVPKCVSRFHGFTLLLVLSLATLYVLRVIRFGRNFSNLLNMRDFFVELLEIPEADIQTITWPAVVEKLHHLRATHPSQSSMPNESDSDAHHATVFRLDAHDVANRIMRKENYLIALFNKRVLNLAVPIPSYLVRFPALTYITDVIGIRTTTLNEAAQLNYNMPSLSRTLEWNLSFCLLGLLFGPDGQVRPVFLQERRREDLIKALQRRLILMAFLNAIFAPFIILYLLFYSFFRYFEEYHKNPSSIGSRTYTQLARWKFREFNELPHIFQQRLHRSYPLADAYMNQFPNDRNAKVARFVAFVAGSFASVLVLFSLIDPDAFLHFEITKDRTVLFYITVFGSIMAVARGMVPDDHRVVDSESLMRDLIEETHYLPAEWRGKLHSAEVHKDFTRLFPLKISLFVQEIISVLTTPLVLWFTLPRCAPAIVDFFREFTIHIDGMGHVCSFAVFDFHRHGDIKFGAPVQGRNDLVSSQGKLEKSVLNFKTANPDWQPQDQATSLYLSRITEAAAMGQQANKTSRRPLTNRRQGLRFTKHATYPVKPSPASSPIFESESEACDEEKRHLGRKAEAFDIQFPEHLKGAIAEESGLGDLYISTTQSPPMRSAQTETAKSTDLLSGHITDRPSVFDLLYEGAGSRSKW